MTPEEITEIQEENSETLSPEDVTEIQEEIPDKRQKIKKILELYRKGGSVLLLLLAVVLVGYYILFPSRGYFHSDTADTIMWAEASYESGKIFDPDFGYACLLPFGTSLIMQALMPFTGVTMTTHVLGMLIFFLLFSGTLILMLRRMGWNIGWISLTVTSVLMICSGSVKLREIFWGHTIYYSLGVLFIFTGLSMIFRQMQLAEQAETLVSPKKKKENRLQLILCCIVIFIWFLLTGTDQISAITIFSLPVIGAVFCERWLDKNTNLLSKRNLYALIVLLIMLIGTVAGYFLTKYLAGDITANYADSYSQYSKMDKWLDNFHKFPIAWLSLLGVEIADNEPLMSGKSVQALMMIITGIFMLLLPVIALFFWKQMQDAKLKILLLTYWFMTLLIMMGYIMGKLSVANWRLSPIVAMSVVVSLAFLRWAFSQTEWQRISVLLLVCMMFVSGIHAKTIAAMPKDNTSKNGLYEVAAEMERRNLNYGYASFWNANALTIISDSKVKSRGVAIDNGVWFRKYQVSERWFKEQPGQSTYFLLLTNKEAESLREINWGTLERPHAEFTFKNYEVWVFEKNIF